MNVKILCSTKHALVQIGDKYVDGTSNLRRNVQQIPVEEENIETRIKGKLNKVAGDARLVISKYQEYRKIGGIYFTAWPSDNYVENGIQHTEHVTLPDQAQPLTT